MHDRTLEAVRKQMMTDHNNWAKIASTADTPSASKKTSRRRTAQDHSNDVIN